MPQSPVYQFLASHPDDVTFSEQYLIDRFPGIGLHDTRLFLRSLAVNGQVEALTKDGRLHYVKETK
jgi:hypothetical protein